MPRTVIRQPSQTPRTVIKQLSPSTATTDPRMTVIRTTGIPGPPGPPGPPGSGGGGGFYTHTQMLASTVWTVVHNLGYFPSVTIFDSSGDQLLADIDPVIPTTSLTITFSSSVSGVAYLS